MLLFTSILPGVFIKYDVEPISVKITETRTSFSHFLTRMCGIVGGELYFILYNLNQTNAFRISGIYVTVGLFNSILLFIQNRVGPSKKH
jgi:hypothetical protein